MPWNSSTLPAWAFLLLSASMWAQKPAAQSNRGVAAQQPAQTPAAMGPTAAPPPQAAKAHSRPGAGPPPKFVDVAPRLGLTASHISSPGKHYVIESMSGGIGLF